MNNHTKIGMSIAALLSVLLFSGSAFAQSDVDILSEKINTLLQEVKYLKMQVQAAKGSSTTLRAGHDSGCRCGQKQYDRACLIEYIGESAIR
jgi:outer membrane murein-binding lipoprotein Lpp